MGVHVVLLINGIYSVLRALHREICSAYYHNFQSIGLHYDSLNPGSPVCILPPLILQIIIAIADNILEIAIWIASCIL